ncbi:hypothetical protein BC831DRAFT_412608 [Entophlyctis helioformis]|nr:hypothetical protein BC831DRAFT_412608 [Entophlyctis helioformis]
MLLPKKVSRRVGNWCEETVLREEKLREFLAKIESGDASFKRRDRRLELANMPTPLSRTLLFNENILIQSLHTRGFVAVDVPTHFPALVHEDILPATATSDVDFQNTKARTIFRLIRKTDLGPGFDTRPRWGEKFYIAVYLPEVPHPLFLASDLRTPIVQNGIRRQRTYLTFTQDYNAVWQFEWLDKSLRMEMEGRVVQPFTPGLLMHSQTGNCLSTDTDAFVRNEFGVEWRLDCHSHRDNCTRLELEANYFAFCVADLPAELVQRGQIPIPK